MKTKIKTKKERITYILGVIFLILAIFSLVASFLSNQGMKLIPLCWGEDFLWWCFVSFIIVAWIFANWNRGLKEKRISLEKQEKFCQELPFLFENKGTFFSGALFAIKCEISEDFLKEQITKFLKK